jgi:dienelactone hydrolase
MVHWLLCLGLIGLAPEQGTARFDPGPGETSVPEFFRLPAAEFSYDLEPLRETPDLTFSALRFPSPIESPDAVNNTVHCEYFQPKGEGRRPAVVVLHILGADFALSRFMAARLADHGVAALFLKLPYYGERRPEGIDRRMISMDLDRSRLTMQQGVCDVRRALAWLKGRPEVDPAKLGVTGISLGGIVSSLVAAVDPSVDRAVLLLAGGDLANILWNMPELEARRARERWIAAGLTPEKLAEITAPFDPITHAAGMKGKRVLMMAGRVDEVIPPTSTTALWEAAGRPPIRWMDCGHYSAAGYLLPAIREAAEFLAADSP